MIKLRVLRPPGLRVSSMYRPPPVMQQQREGPINNCFDIQSSGGVQIRTIACEVISKQDREEGYNERRGN